MPGFWPIENFIGQNYAIFCFIQWFYFCVYGFCLFHIQWTIDHTWKTTVIINHPLNAAVHLPLAYVLNLPPEIQRMNTGCAKQVKPIIVLYGFEHLCWRWLNLIAVPKVSSRCGTGFCVYCGTVTNVASHLLTVVGVKSSTLVPQDKKREA